MARRTLYISALALILALTGSVGAQETINFDDLPAGTVLVEVFGSLGSGPVLVNGNNPNLSGNAAVVFDSTTPSGGDDDLGTPNVDFGGAGIGAGGSLGAEFENNSESLHLLILAEDLEDIDGDGIIDDPDDADVEGATLEFDFSAIGSIEATAITIIDVEAEELAATVELFDEDGMSLSVVELPQVGNNGKARIELGDTSGVASMTVTLNGSGAIDNLEFDPECDLGFTLSQDTVAPGEELVIDLSLVHRDESTRTPFSMWLENDLGEVLGQQSTKPIEMNFGDTITHQGVFPIRSDMAPGTYTVVVGTRDMRQGIAWAEKTFTVTE